MVTTSLNVKQKWSVVWIIRVKDVLYIASREEVVTKVNHEYPKVRED